MTKNEFVYKDAVQVIWETKQVKTVFGPTFRSSHIDIRICPHTIYMLNICPSSSNTTLFI